MTAVGDVLGGKYELIRKLGEGGMGEVFEAINKNTDRRVAIKTLHSRWTGESDVVQRFLREARAATKIRHPNVVDVLDLDVDARTGAPYIVQEFLSGGSLEEYVAGCPGARLPAEEALRILVPVMEALVAAHALGIVHRDLKPANLFLADGHAGASTPKVIDFGIAKIMATHADSQRQTVTGALVGTPRYMSPEQAMGASDLDARTDVWSLGVVFYELLTGALPYEGANYNVLVAKIVYEEPFAITRRDASLPLDVVAVVDHALQKNRDARFPSMQAMLDATRGCQAFSAGVSDPPTRVSRGLAASVPPGSPAAHSSPSIASWSDKTAPAPRRALRGTLVAVALGAMIAVVAGYAVVHRTANPVALGRPIAVPYSPVPASPSPAAPPASPIPPSPAEVVAPAAPVAAVVAPAAPAAPPAAPAAPPAAPAAPLAAPVDVEAAQPPRALGRRPRPHRPAGPAAAHDFDRGYPE